MSRETPFTVAEIAILRAETKIMKLEGREILDRYTNAELARIYNGIGPDGFPCWLRSLESALHWSLLAVALIHDVQWYERELRGAPATAKQDRKDFRATNAMFRRNGFRAANYHHPDSWLLRNWVRWDSIKFQWLCNRAVGFAAWQTAGA